MTKDRIITIFAEEETSELLTYIKKAEEILSKDKNLISALKLFGHSFADLSMEMEKVAKMDPDVIFSRVKKYFEDIQEEASASGVTTYEEGLSAAATSDILNFGLSKLLKFSADDESEEDREDEETELFSVEEESEENTTYSEEDHTLSEDDIAQIIYEKEEERYSLDRRLFNIEEAIKDMSNDFDRFKSDHPPDEGTRVGPQEYYDKYEEEINDFWQEMYYDQKIYEDGFPRETYQKKLKEEQKKLEKDIQNIDAEISKLEKQLRTLRRDQSFRNVYNLFGKGVGKVKNIGSGVIEKGSNAKERVKEFSESEAGKITLSAARNGIAAVIAAIISPIGVLPGLFYDFDAKKKGKLIAFKNPISLTNLAVCCFIVAFSGLSYYMAYESLGLTSDLSMIAAYIGLIASSNLLSSGARAVSKGVYSIGKSKQTFEEIASTPNKQEPTPDKKQGKVNLTGTETKEQLKELYKKNKDQLTPEQKEAILNKIFED